MSADEIRSDLLKIIGENPGGHEDDSVREAYKAKLAEYAAADGSDGADVVFAIGKSVFGVDLDGDGAAPPVAKKAKTAEAPPSPLPIVDFDYMKAFMKDVFLSYGCTPDRAEVCSDVLIEADKRGIDSHGLGRLKPIYCDRMDQGILWADRPIDIISESDTTALVDGNLGLGLYIGPHCMQMAIDKAKKYGVGFVACKNSTVSCSPWSRLYLEREWCKFIVAAAFNYRRSTTELRGTTRRWPWIRDVSDLRGPTPVPPSRRRSA